jgi:hypothetical protein
MWRACSSILPTEDNLLKKGVVKEELCMFWKMERETVLHILWECPSSMDVWGTCAINIQKITCKFFSFLEVVDELMQQG